MLSASLRWKTLGASRGTWGTCSLPVEESCALGVASQAKKKGKLLPGRLPVIRNWVSGASCWRCQSVVWEMLQVKVLQDVGRIWGPPCLHQGRSAITSPGR